ncbi:MAG: hypothetical protein ACRD2L_23325, partial [Terriglobia bacterium]
MSKVKAEETQAELDQLFESTASKARERLNARRRTKPDFLRDESGALDPDALRDAALIGALKLRKGYRRFESWREEMIKELGEPVKSHLDRIYRVSNTILLREEGQRATEKPLEAVLKVKPSQLERPTELILAEKEKSFISGEIGGVKLGTALHPVRALDEGWRSALKTSETIQKLSERASQTIGEASVWIAKHAHPVLRLREHPVVQEVMLKARTEVDIRKSQLSDIIDEVTAQKPTKEEEIILDRLNLRLPVDVSKLRPKIRQILDSVLGDVTKLSKGITGEKKALGLPIRDEYLHDASKSWFPHIEAPKEGKRGL